MSFLVIIVNLEYFLILVRRIWAGEGALLYWFKGQTEEFIKSAYDYKTAASEYSKT